MNRVQRAIVRVVGVHTPASEAMLKTAAELGVGLRDSRPERPRVDGAAILALDAMLGSGQTALVCGASGSGKSVLLRTLAGMMKEEGRRVAVARPVNRNEARLKSVIDLVVGEREERLAILAAAGLGEARVLVQRASELSEGQRARFSLAIAMSGIDCRAARSATLIVDEFGSTLDRVSAWALAAAVARWARRSGTRIIAATAHDDLLGPLHPHVLVLLGNGGRAGPEGSARVLWRRAGESAPCAREGEAA